MFLKFSQREGDGGRTRERQKKDRVRQRDSRERVINDATKECHLMLMVA